MCYGAPLPFPARQASRGGGHGKGLGGTRKARPRPGEDIPGVRQGTAGEGEGWRLIQNDTLSTTTREISQQRGSGAASSRADYARPRMEIKYSVGTRARM